MSMGDRRPWSMKLFGHRGCSASIAENTLSSVRKALEMADGAELDVMRTLDGVMVVLHDSTLARTALPWPGRRKPEDLSRPSLTSSSISEEEYYRLVNTNVSELTYDEIKDVRVGRYVLPRSKNARSRVCSNHCICLDEALMSLNSKSTCTQAPCSLHNRCCACRL